MPERLSVEPAGLRAAAAQLTGQMHHLASTGTADRLGERPSLAGAMVFAAGVDAFAAAYAHRLKSRSDSIAAAAGEYATRDGNAAQTISSVRL